MLKKPFPHVFFLIALPFFFSPVSQACSIPSGETLEELREEPEINPFNRGNEVGAKARAVVRAGFDRFFRSATSYERFPNMGMKRVKWMELKEGPRDRQQGKTSNIFWTHQEYDLLVTSIGFSDFLTIDSNSGMNGNLKWGNVHFYLTPNDIVQSKGFPEKTDNTLIETMDGAVEICEMPENEVFVTYTLTADLTDGMINNLLEWGMGKMLEGSLERMLEVITEDATR